MRRLAAGIAAVVSLSLLWSGPAPAATAKNPPPPASLAGTSIDAHLGYMPQSTCSPTAKPGTTALLSALIKTWGGSSSGISRQCGVGATSEHKEGRALDWRMDMKSASQRARVKQATDWLTANNGEVAYRLGVMYIMWNQQIWSLYYRELGWRKLADRGSYTANHKNHVHISLSWDGAMKQTSWWTGAPITDPLNSRCGANGARACLPTIARTSSAWPYQTTVVPESFLPAPWTTPGIGGGPQVGRTLTAVPGTWVPAGASLAYQWTADGSDIPGATAQTWVVIPEAVGRTIRVRVTATTADGSTTKTTDGTTDVVRARFTTAPKPKIVGTVATDQTVTADAGAWAPEPGSLTYRWRRNGDAIKGATSQAYVITPADTGERLTVTVTARRDGFYTNSETSAAQTVAKAEFSTVPVPVVSGDFVAGASLTADPGSWEPTPSGMAYAWFADGAKLTGATGPTLVLTRAHVGKSLQVRVKAARPGYRTTYVRSVAAVVAPAG